jgi:antibiotic biosynthesis monooxygenase (ABM) superfamily enzyme
VALILWADIHCCDAYGRILKKGYAQPVALLASLCISVPIIDYLTLPLLVKIFGRCLFRKRRQVRAVVYSGGAGGFADVTSNSF